MARHGIRKKALMLVDERRIFYRGAIPDARDRCVGGYVFYLTLGSPFLFRRSGDWTAVTAAITEPYEVHSVRGEGEVLVQYILEQEDARLGLGCATAKEQAIVAFVSRYEVRSSLWSVSGSWVDDLAGKVDPILFPKPVQRRIIDDRIRTVIDQICEQPADRHSAGVCAALADLSVSRFLHVFSQEIGASFRKFLAWKRARALFHAITEKMSLTEVALDAGYADSCHFSNAVKSIYGLRPKDMWAAGRDAEVVYGIRQAAISSQLERDIR
ncbi:helix-turn-helix domain-containing protein [Segnochrobactrum spirostomi]|uniref:Helix-turn-helix transcriptional regulator n=1 Tax=Segnochrobactrum spirostomi TaxID=2608987 RepID=A0A6A7YBR5_9HYPH|nr:AraC family transcriptional regulator [Segnochrobactrum spirostomi]MQT15102.1 helix-turn-helix transcriptional regulator [Segnochrobactrum spirostomi]